MTNRKRSHTARRARSARPGSSEAPAREAWTALAKRTLTQ